jgi:hypothetical protein
MRSYYAIFERKRTPAWRFTVFEAFHSLPRRMRQTNNLADGASFQSRTKENACAIVDIGVFDRVIATNTRASKDWSKKSEYLHLRFGRREN